ncbi:MAG TPA: hypothetical protein VH081_03460 [Solirubrobacteraceae bacterium]|nr:hypothetical protein [Solirubrobacteraceae bacterium]
MVALRGCVLAALALAVFSGSALAADGGGASSLVVIPRSASEPALSYLELAGTPGHSESAGAIELVNPSSRTVRAALAPVDSVTLDTLGSSYRPRGARVHGATRWLALSNRTIVLDAHARTTATVDVRVPRGAAPGDYLSGVSLEALDQAPVQQHARHSGGRASTASVVRYAIGVETTLPGTRRPRLRFTGATIHRAPAGLTFSLDARNDGNVILKDVRGEVRILRDGRVVLSRPIAAGTFVTGTSIAYPVPAFDQRPSEGTHYRVEAELIYAGGAAHIDKTLTFGHRAAVTQQRFGGPPAGGGGDDWWKLALVVAAILYCVLTTTLLLRRRRRSASEQGADAGPARRALGADGPPR